MGTRPERVAELIKEALTLILRDKVKDPHIGFVTITEVKLTGDLRFARVYVSIMGDETAKQKTIASIERATGFIRRQLGERIRIKFVPELRFIIDDSLDRSQHIDDILKKIKESG
ncbi:MAG: 30S ribosome-binding factor RbfA [Candidatus Omnitrophota bacterium]